MKNPFRPLTALTLASAIALSPVGAAPAKANDADLFVAGAIGTAILGALALGLMNDQNTTLTVRPSQPQQVHKPQPQKPTISTKTHSRDNRDTPFSRQIDRDIDHRRHDGGFGDRTTRHSKPTIPAACAARGFSGRGGDTLYRKNCLVTSMPRADRLPDYCARTVINHNTGNRRQLFSGRCLEGAGYRVSRR